MNWQFSSILIHSLILLPFWFWKQKKTEIDGHAFLLSRKEKRVRVTTQQQMSTSQQSKIKINKSEIFGRIKNPFTGHSRKSPNIWQFSLKTNGGWRWRISSVFFDITIERESNESRCVVVKRKSEKNSRTGRTPPEMWVLLVGQFN